ncbi:MAG TPA: ATP-grasp domain-containing protein [Gemmatimonadaceae bacterium]|nr:ATP-grasp domain-containing protein [Gemmatimonadaceae bacterium]
MTDGHLRPSLAIVRSLGRAGYRVFVCSPRRRSLAGVSRFAVAEAQVPDPLSQPAQFAEAVASLASRWQVEIVLPVSEEAILALLPAADRMAGVRIPTVPLDVFRRVADKEAVTALAATLGIAVPKQVVLRDKDGLIGSELAAISFPVVLKPARSVSGEGPDREKLGVSYANDRDELQHMVEVLSPSAFPLLLQERIQGPGTGIFLLTWKGRLIAQFAHRRIREKPPSGGVSVCAESIEADPQAVERSLTLLEALNWSGPAMVEFKQDRSTGRLYLMEINGRFWGSLQLAIDAGVDFPALLLGAALGAEPAPVTRYAVGVRVRWWWGEVDHLLARLRGRANSPELGSRLAAVGRFLWPGAGVKNEVWRVSDPRPALRETMEWVRGR